MTKKRKKLHKILFVDDEYHSIKLFERSFKREFNIISTTNPQEAIDIIIDKGEQLSAILCDQKMPKITGLEIFKISKSVAPQTIRIMISSYIDTDTLMECINECQIYSYILKPYEPHDLSQLLQEALVFRERELKNRLILNDIRELLFGTIGAICEALEEKDTYTIGHSRRVTAYSLIIAQELGLSAQEIEQIKLAGLLHDIGKIGVPESILNKPGRLTDFEFGVIKKHPERGANIIKNIKQLGIVVDWVRHHHERYDGFGYPDKLVGEDIPFGSAILAVADTYDAMTSDRAYRKGLSHEIAVEEIKKCSGAQFNPKCAEAFLRVHKSIEAIMNDKETHNKYSISQLLNRSTTLLKKTS